LWHYGSTRLELFGDRTVNCFTQIIALLLGATAALSHASNTTTITTDCDAASFQRLLHAATTSAASSRAIWFSSRMVRWPKVASEGRFRIYYSARASLNASIGEAVSGADEYIALSVRTTPLDAPISERFKYVESGVTLSLVQRDVAKLTTMFRAQSLLVRENESGRVIEATALQVPGALDELYRRDEVHTDFGTTLAEKRTQFRVWAPTAQNISVCIHKGGTSLATQLIPLRSSKSSGTWSTQVNMNLRGYYYTYLVDVFVNGVGIVRNRVTDPYSVSLSTDSKRSFIADLRDSALQVKNWSPLPRSNRVKHATDMSIYELHVRDFSMNDSTVSAANRGKYMAFTELQSNGMKHLKALSDAGLTDVHLLPIFDFATVPEKNCVTPRVGGDVASESQQAAVVASKDKDCYNWGYDPFHFNAPEGSYASDASDGQRRIVELREMIRALRSIGLRVGMDVVYNHTSSSGQHEKSVLDRIVPGYYHRLNAEGKVETSTCCDNTATEHMMMEKLMSDSVVLWAKHYQMESFRFDLMGHQPRAAMERLQRRLKAETERDIQLIGEGWNFGEVENGKRFVQASQLSLNGTGVGTFSDRGRDAARGGGFGDNAQALIKNQGFLNGLIFDPNALAPPERTKADLMRTADMIRVGLAGSIRDYTMRSYRDEFLMLEKIDYNGSPAGYVTQPSEVVNYVENHDNETLFDLNAYKLPIDTSREDRARVQVLGIALTAFSQGVPYFHAGIDTLRSKSMDRNSYDSGDWFNRLDWTYQDNFFATGLPRKDDNGGNWPVIAERLANASIKPLPEHIAWTRDAFRDLLRIRASSSLFRLRTADDVKERLRFYNIGSQQVATTIVGHLNGAGHLNAAFNDVVYLINVDKLSQTIIVPELNGISLSLHPVHANGADERIKSQAKFNTARGSFEVPARSAVVFVRN
jgi:pullulanase